MIAVPPVIRPDLVMPCALALESLDHDGVTALLRIEGANAQKWSADQMRDLECDGTDTILVNDETGRFEAAMNLYWSWGPGCPEETSGIATGRLIDGTPTIDALIIHI